MVYLNVDDKWIQRIKETLPELPHDKKERYIKELGLPEYDSDILTSSKALAAYFEECVKVGANPKDASNWIMGELLRTMKEAFVEIEDIKIKPLQLSELVELVNKGTISGTIAKKVFKDMFETGDDPEKIVKEKGMVQVSDEGAIRDIINGVLDGNPQSIADFKSGKTRAMGFLVGQIMKASKGKANPQLVNKLLEEELSKR
jgi:aspartyl-tRNA(Asn)/glutamyl-tRNA(Gln) amidotransferase subunit B